MTKMKTKTKTNIKGSNILITGGTGSFGNRVAVRMEELHPNSITIYSRDEKKQYEMKKIYPNYNYVIGDVRDVDRVKDVMKGIDIVFNAAALKQVPSCELYPEEAIKTNTIGALNICRAAVENDVKVVVGLSTDKAVKPINVMGMSKALMEKIICSYGRRFKGKGTIFCCVRYGNVMGSRGSVIPLFKEQIESGTSVTITVSEMTRFLLTLDQAIDLVLYAVENSNGGEIFVKKAPACTMKMLADCMIKKYWDGRKENIEEKDGKKGKEYNIKIIGIRAGEKLHETLINEYEMLFTDDMGDYYIINDTLEGKIIEEKVIESMYVEYTSANTRQIVDYDELSMLLDNVTYDKDMR